MLKYDREFLSTPSARRATCQHSQDKDSKSISIHALREEGDLMGRVSMPQGKDFYPRPPRGGRLGAYEQLGTAEKFLSTPSARRATLASYGIKCDIPISIHALREEGDECLD